VQANCPSCGNKIVIDDARVPDRPFSVKCPKCSNAIKLPGKGAAAAPAPAEEEASVPEVSSAPPPAVAAGSAGRALIALPDKSHAASIGAVVTRAGYAVDTIDDWEEGGRLLEQGVYQLVVTARVAAAAGKGETLYQRINRLSPEPRRNIFLILLGDEFKTADGTQAFATLCDMVIHSKDAAGAERALRNTLSERQRLYQVYMDAQHRHLAAAGVA
jgi:predicted Zn finger-like uncharacterized protein